MSLEMGSLSNGMRYVNRENPTNHDFIKEDLIIDNQWHDLDFSNMVSTRASLIHLRIRFLAPSLAPISFRKKGEIGYNKVTAKILTANVWHYNDVFVSCDLNAIIQYFVTDVAWNNIDIVVKGWFEKVGGGGII